MSDAEIMALLSKRMKAAEEQFLNSDIVKLWKAYNAHILFEHGSGELCACPEWDHARPKHIASKP